MKKIIFFALIVAFSLHAEEKADTEKLSEAIGHLIGKNLQSMNVPIDVNALVKGMKEGCSSNTSLDEEACAKAIAEWQEKDLSKQAEKNLCDAKTFLEKNRKERGVISLEENKVQYRVLKAGKGSTIQPYNSPLMRYQGRYLNGQSFGGSSGEEVVSLDETIEGFKKGTLGMREGEVRTIFIHPDLGYGRHGLSMPNALLIFEVELIKADASADAQAASNADDLPEKFLPAR